MASGLGLGILGGCNFFRTGSELPGNAGSSKNKDWIRLLTNEAGFSVYSKTQQWNARELWEATTSRGLQCRNGVIELENRILLESDAPGLGTIDEDSWETIGSGIILRKTFIVEQNIIGQTTLTMLVYPLHPAEPMNGGRLMIHVNGYGPIFQEVRHFWTTTPIPQEYLRKGENVVEVTVQDEQLRFRMPIASYANFKYGTDTDNIPEYGSARSLDNGKTWSRRGLGANHNQEGEYPIRLRLGSYREKGWMETGSMDLGPTRGDEVLRLPAIVNSAQVSLNTEAERASGIVIKIRSGRTHQPEAGEWTSWRQLSGNDATPEGTARYVQFRFEMVSDSGERTPAITGFELSSESEVTNTGWHKNIDFVAGFSSPIVRSSFDFRHENTLHTALQQFRVDYDLDSIVKEARTEFEKVLKLRNWVAGKWEWFLPDADTRPQTYWNAMEILKDRDENGTYKQPGGYCLYYSIVMAQACQSFGIPARIVNLNYGVMGGHEVVEIWSRDYGKWIMMDPNFDSMFVCRETATPLNALELHRTFLKTYYPEGDIVDRDLWTDEDRDRRSQSVEPSRLPLSMQTDNKALSGTLKDYVWWKITPGPAPGYSGGYGFFNTAYVRWLPRSNWLSQPRPMPINHGRTHWGWDGYLAWTDSQTPPSPEHRYFVRRDSDMYGNLYSVDFTVEPGGEEGHLEVSLATDSPNFDHFEVNDNNRRLQVKETRYVWELSVGRNRLELQAVDTLGNKGAMSYMIINYVPV